VKRRASIALVGGAASKRPLGRATPTARLADRNPIKQSLQTIPTSPSSRNADVRRRALELLAGSRDGCTEAHMLAHGFSIDLLVELINAKLASAQPERTVAGGQQTEVTRVRITAAGERALAKTSA